MYIYVCIYIYVYMYIYTNIYVHNTYNILQYIVHNTNIYIYIYICLYIYLIQMYIIHILYVSYMFPKTIYII